MKLSVQMLNWIIQSVDRRAEIQSIVRLKGSTSSTLHGVNVLIKGSVLEVVVRQFDNQTWLAEEPDIVIHEADSLRQVEKAHVQAPRLIAYDETGDACGVPAILMTKLDGYVDLKPKNPQQWVHELARKLVSIHNVSTDDFGWAYEPYHDMETWPFPSWSKHPELWGELLKVTRESQPKYQPCLVHRDYHPANVLWQDNKISGIVDWPSSCKGPAGIDIGHCRVNLAMLYDVETADEFLMAYEQYAHADFVYEPYWDIISLIDILDGPPTVYPGWSAFGITGLTDAMMEERIDTYMKSLYVRLTED